MRGRKSEQRSDRERHQGKGGREKEGVKCDRVCLCGHNVTQTNA